MIEKILNPILAPFRRLASQWAGVKNVKANLEGDVGRVKRMKDNAVNDAKAAKADADKVLKKGKDAKGKAGAAAAEAKDAKEKAGKMAGQAQGAVGQAQGMMPGQQPGAPGQKPGGHGPGAPPAGLPPRPGMPGAPPPGAYGAAPAAGGGYGGGGAPAAPQKTMAFMVGSGSSATVLLLGWVVPLKGPHRGELHNMKQTTVFGKEPGCDVVFNDAFMSGRHATIRAQGGVFMLEDHSTNGTFVNDKKVKTHELVDNDFVKFGQTLVKFKCL